MSDGREEREEQEWRRKQREKEKEGDQVDRPYREREWDDRGHEPS
jgi:hypothetical protein